MISSYICYNGHDRIKTVRCIFKSAHTRLDKRDINMLGKIYKSHHSNNFEFSRMHLFFVQLLNGRIYFIETTNKRFFCYWCMIHQDVAAQPSETGGVKYTYLIIIG